MAMGDLQSDGFTEFRCDRSFSMGMNLTILEKNLNCAGENEALTIIVQDGADRAKFIIETPNLQKVLVHIFSCA